MKLSKRSITLLVCLMTAVTLTVTGTIAYLTDTAAVTNTFTVGKVQITLDEAIVTTDGVPTTDPVTGATRTDKGNNYHLIPGKTYTKDPVTTVLANSESSYVRMLVTITEYDKLVAAFTAHGETFTPAEWVKDYDATKWGKNSAAVDSDGNLTMEYRYFTTVGTMGLSDQVLPALFTSFTVPGFLTGEEMAELQTMEIIVQAQAIQAESFDSADAAWAAFEDAKAPVTQSEAEVQPEADPQPEEGVIPAEDDTSDATT